MVGSYLRHYGEGGDDDGDGGSGDDGGGGGGLGDGSFSGDDKHGGLQSANIMYKGVIIWASVCSIVRTSTSMHIHCIYMRICVNIGRNFLCIQYMYDVFICMRVCLPRSVHDLHRRHFAVIRVHWWLCSLTRW